MGRRGGCWRFGGLWKGKEIEAEDEDERKVEVGLAVGGVRCREGALVAVVQKLLGTEYVLEALEV